MTALLQLAYVAAAVLVIAGGVAGCLFLAEVIAYLLDRLSDILRGER